MARMSIDDKFPRDPRVIKLGRRCGWSRRETMGALIDVFQIVYDRERDTLPAEDIDITAEHEGFADAMIACELAEQTRHGVRVKGAAERIAYLKHNASSGRVGGLKSGESRRNRSAQNRSDPSSDPSSGARSAASGDAQALGNPPDPVPDPASAPVLVPDPAPVPDPPLPPLPPKGGSHSRSRPKVDVTPEERAAFERIMTRLSKASGVSYQGSEAHLRLILAQLRDGVHELELRAVVAYCADEWAEKPEMRQYLRPETLFGPKTIQRYLDPARTKYAAVIAEEREKLQPQPRLELVS